MGNENEERQLTFKELFYILKRHIISEIAIIAVCAIVGIILSVTNEDVYVASLRVSVKANIKQDISYNDTSLSKMIMPTIEDFISNDSIIIEEAKEKSGYTDISATAISASHNEDSLIMTVSYTDVTAEGAKNKLTAIVNSAQEVVKQPNSNTDSQMSKYFFAIIELEPVQSVPVVVQKNNDLRVIVISVLMGLAIAFAVSMLTYVISDKILTESALERITGKKNIVCVPGRRAKTYSNKDFKPLDLTQLSDSLIYIKESKSSVVYQVQSTTQSEGKSTIATNLAVALAEAGRKVVIIDCDLKKRKIHRLLKLENCNDLMEYFKDEKSFGEIINHTEMENMDVITANSAVKNHTMVFTSEKFGALIKEAKENYEFVILDCGPVGLISDYINISKWVDGTLLVVSCNYIKSRDLKITVNKLEDCNANVVGTVFNFCNERDYYQDYYQK